MTRLNPVLHPHIYGVLSVKAVSVSYRPFEFLAANVSSSKGIL